jgi:hypothetical protein
MRTCKIRHQFYLPDDLSRALKNLAAEPGASKTAILADALRAWIERKSADELDTRLGRRLDRHQNIAQRSELMLNAIAEMLDLFIAHQLSLTAHQPPVDAVTSQLGHQRHQQLIDKVAQRLASNSGMPRLLAKTLAQPKDE